MNRNTLYRICVLAAMAVCFITAPSLAQLVDVTAPGDPITAIWNTMIGGNSTASTAGTGSAGQYPAGEPAPAAIDNNLATKYLNFGTGGGAAVTSATKGVGTGFYVTPAAGPSTLLGVRMGTANDARNRDPINISIEGSNATGADLTQGANWTLIYNGPSGLEGVATFMTLGPVQSFPNTTPYTSYRVLVQSQRGVDNSVQYSEIQLLVPEPALLPLLGLGLCAIRRRR